MSQLLIDQDWETDATPVTFSGTCARSTTNAIDGTDIRGGDGTAKDGSWGYTPAAFSRLSAGSAQALVARSRFKFKRQSGPTGGLATVMNYQVPGVGNNSLIIPDGASKFRLSMYGAASTVNGTATLTAATAYWVDYEVRLERKYHWARVWIDGVLDIEVRTGSFASGSDVFEEFSVGGSVSASGKCSWEFIWGRMKVWASRDPLGSS